MCFTTIPLGLATVELTVHNRAVLHPHQSAPGVCTHGGGYAHAHRHMALRSESCLSQSDNLSSWVWRVTHFHELSTDKEKVPVSRQGESKGVAVHLLMDLAGVAENGTRAGYPQSSTSWTLPSAFASDGGNHVKTSHADSFHCKDRHELKSQMSTDIAKGITFTQHYSAAERPGSDVLHKHHSHSRCLQGRCKFTSWFQISVLRGRENWHSTIFRISSKCSPQ